MNRRPLFVAISFCLFAVMAFAGPAQIIRLKDQSTVRGEILSMQKGVYSVKTAALGTLQIPADQVLAIISEEMPTAESAPVRIREGRPGNMPTATSPANTRRTEKKPLASEPASVPQDSAGLQQDVSGRVQSMMMDKQFSEQVMGLSENKNMEDVLGDQETMNQINSGDYEGLMNNEKIKNLMESSDIKSLLGDMDE